MSDIERVSAPGNARRRLWVLAAIVLIGARPACAPSAAPRKPNILLISIDTLRADHLSSYGYARPTSPFIDSLAADGIRFDRAYATSSWTTPSVVSMLTSTYQNRHGMGARLRGIPRMWSKIPEELPNLAEALRRLGYRTFGLTANTNLTAERGFDRGFGRYKCLGTADLSEVEQELEPYLRAIARDEGPWFFWLHMLDPHGPYNGRRPWIRKFDPGYLRHRRLDGMAPEIWAAEAAKLGERPLQVVRALYDSEIRDTDEFLRRLFGRLSGAEDAFVLFTADHGEEFLEHGGTLHGRTLFDESIRIPFIVRLPDRRFAGTVVDEAVSLIDVLPTVLAVAGGGRQRGAAGLNLVTSDGAEVPEGRVVVAELLRGLPERATTDGRWKYITKAKEPGRVELYDLGRDSAEQDNVSRREQNARQIARFEELLAAFELVHSATAQPLQQTEITPEQLEALRALGYVGSD